jgi:hypothetical protein
MYSIAFNLDQKPSPYDVFLTKNGLPTAPNQGESSLAYAQRLLGLINQLGSPKFVTPRDGVLRLHRQRFQFGATELQGLKVFFNRPSAPASGGAGNCVSCHTPPAFTDNIFHNTGASQLEYDAVFGAGQFEPLVIPDCTTRPANCSQLLSPTTAPPDPVRGVQRPQQLHARCGPSEDDRILQDAVGARSRPVQSVPAQRIAR